MIRIIHRCMTNSKLTEKKWDGHFAFFHLKEFKNHKEIYLNGKPLKWWMRFKNGDVIEVIDKPEGIITALVSIGAAIKAAWAAFAIAHPIVAGVIGFTAKVAVLGGLSAGLSSALGGRSSANATTQNKEYSSVSQPELKGASNDISDDIIPVIFGRTQQTPSYAQTPYRLVGDGTAQNKYRQYFIANYNNVTCSDFKLGETSLENYIASYYSITQANASNNFIGFENCRAITIDEELSYDAKGDVNQTVIEDVNQTVTASSVTCSFTLKFENVPSPISRFSNKTFNFSITGENNDVAFENTSSNATVTRSNITQNGNYYYYTGTLTINQSLTTLTSITFSPVSNTRNNSYETNSQLNVYLETMTITAGIYSDTFTENKPVDKYSGIPSEVIQTSPINTTEIDVIFSFSQGLYKLNKDDGSRTRRSIQIEIMYKLVSENTWHNIGDASSLYIRDLDGIKKPLSSTTTKVNGKNITVFSPKDMNMADQLFFRLIGFEVPKGQYNVRVRSAEYGNKSNYDVGYPNCSEIQFRCVGDVVNPVVLPKVRQIAFEVTAYKGLSGTLKKFNYIAEASIPIWNGTDWNTKAKTSNPAAIVRFLLTDDSVNPRAESINHIDNDSLVEYYNWCEESGYKADGIISEACKIGEIINEILQNSQTAMIPLYNGKHTFCTDKPNKIPVGLFNQHNSWNFKWTPILGRQTEAIRASFVENDDWTEDELTLYWYNGQVNEEPEEGKTDLDYELIKKEYNYVCERECVKKIVAFELETTQTKRNQFEFDVNLEAMNMMLLDRVYVSNTANMQNESTGLIKSVITENGYLTGFRLYSDVDIPENAKIVIRSLDYENEKAVINIYDVTNSGTNFIVNINPVLYDGVVRGEGDITGIQDTWHYDGDLFTLGQDTIYDCTVIDIKYNDDGTATIKCRDYGFDNSST